MPPKPRTIWTDVKSFLFRRERHNWFALFMAGAIPAFIIWLFVLDGRTNILPDEPVVIYAESWPLDRSDEDIRARQREFALDENERRALRREQFQRLADELGIDYDRGAAQEADRITEENRRIAAEAEGREAEGEGAGADGR